MQEIWKDVKGYEGLYQVSNLGRIKSLFRFDSLGRKVEEKILKLGKTYNGYLRVNLSKNGRTKKFLVHRLVAEAFITNVESKPEVNHDDGNKENCCVSNLYWATSSENQLHAYRTGLQKITKKQIERFRKLGKQNAKQVNQYDLDGNFIKTWKSTKEVERQLKINHTSICLCCKGNYKTAGGYKWKYLI